MAQRSASCWLLKCPWHIWNLQALLAVYPDAQVVHIHRGLVDTIGSQCSLSARIAEEPTPQSGEHDYDIADYGLTEDQIRATFTDYCQRFGV